MTARPEQAFAVWVTGLPASGKSTVVAELVARLRELGIDAAVLESDELRPILTPSATYAREDRDQFYRALTYVGTLLTKHGVPVIFDATANLRRYRDCARKQIPDFIEVYIECPLAVCMARDPKGIYRKARDGSADAVPGLQAPFEPPALPEVTIQCNEDVEEAVARILEKLPLPALR